MLVFGLLVGLGVGVEWMVVMVVWEILWGGMRSSLIGSDVVKTNCRLRCPRDVCLTLGHNRLTVVYLAGSVGDDRSNDEFGC